jgi:hypothetical protein
MRDTAPYVHLHSPTHPPCPQLPGLLPRLYVYLTSYLWASQTRRPYQLACLPLITLCGKDIKSISSQSWQLLMHYILRLPILVPLHLHELKSRFHCLFTGPAPCTLSTTYLITHPLLHMNSHTPLVVSRKLFHFVTL